MYQENKGLHRIGWALTGPYMQKVAKKVNCSVIEAVLCAADRALVIRVERLGAVPPAAAFH